MDAYVNKDSVDPERLFEKFFFTFERNHHSDNKSI